jgi:CHAT domain-containing protein
LAKALQEQGYERQRLDRERSFAVSKHDSARLAELNAAIASSDAAIATASRRLDIEFPAFRSLGRPVPVTLAQYQARLTPDDVLIAPLRLGGETITVAITHDQFLWAGTTTPSWRLASLIARIRASIDASRASGSKPVPFDVDAARQLYRVIAPPALDAVLKAHRHLYYYASGGLASLPPALLVTGGPGRRGRQPWLIRTHSISVVPTLAAVPTPSGAADPGASFLGVGAPALGPSLPAISSRSVAVRLGNFGDRPLALLPSLPFAARELRQMGSMFGPLHRTLLLDRAATEAAIKTDPLAGYKVIAIATHGLVNGALPGLAEPALVLTPPATPSAMDDGLLTASEVTNLHLDADWVILSACDSASGREPAGASYSGLASAFMAAGARALLVSHWPVRDDAASRITVATLRATRNGTDRATALQRAMIALMDDRSVSGSANPAIWAPFVLVER